MKAFFKMSIVCGMLALTASAAEVGSSFWPKLELVIQSRVLQKHQKMRLEASDAEQFRAFIETIGDSTPNLRTLQFVLPKTTVELLMAVNNRGLDRKEADRMADYLKSVIEGFQFANATAFDENTSHIIGREWSQIDYSGENMTWQKQKTKYERFGILHFKSLECLKRFIPVEAKLPYFRNLYRPKNSTPAFLAD